MADTSIDSSVPTLTRLARAWALLGAQGASVGLVINTFRLWSRLGEFVTSNKMPISERTHLVVALLVPAVAWAALASAIAVLRRGTVDRLTALQRLSLRGSWVIGIGLGPLLLHPTIWRTRGLMFLVATGIATLVLWWAIRLTQQGWFGRRAPSGDSSACHLIDYVVRRFPARLRVVAPVLVIAALVLYTAVRGIWLDATVVPRVVGEPPLAVHSLRQAFVLLGHGGWLGIPVVLLKFLRPPGHAHIFFWVLCIASAAFPLFAWSRRHLGTIGALMVAIAYLSLPMLRTVGRGEVFPLGMAAGLFFWALFEWDRQRVTRAVILTLVTFGAHEQAALWFVCYGLYQIGTPADATYSRRLALAASAYFLLVASVVLPSLDMATYGQAFKGIWGTKPVGLIETIHVSLTNPVFVLNRWVELQGLAFWLTLLVPMAFLPIVVKNWLVWFMPGVLFAVVAVGRMPSTPVTTGAAAHFVVLGLVASILVLARLRATEATRPLAQASLVAWAFALMASVYQLGGLWLPAI